MDAIEKLTTGYKAFRDGHFKVNQSKFEDLVDHGQKPKVALIACADSRVDPAALLQADPGDLFIVRNVANLVPPMEEQGSFHGTSAALEFAVQHLEVEHLIVLGHAHCGGIRSLFGSGKKNQGDRERPTYFIEPWMSLVKSAWLRVEGTMPDAPMETKARVCEQSAVLVSLENLMTFTCIQRRVADGRLRLHGWYVDIRSGTLHRYNPQQQAFEAVE